MLLSVLIPFSAFAENNNLGTTHGNAIFLKKVTLERKDVYGNAVDCVLEAYFVYGDYEENSIVYIYKEYLSPSTDDSNWHLKKASSTDPTTIIVLSSPYSGEPSQFRIGTIVPSLI